MYKKLTSTIQTLGDKMTLNSISKELYGFANSFDKSMHEVSTISKSVSNDMNAFKESVLEMATQIPVGANDAAKALYQIISAGHDGANGMQVLQASAKAAIGGMTETTIAADAITTVMNAYGKGADEACIISDQLFTTARLGQITFGDLAQSISQVVPIAASLGIQSEQVLAAVATLANSGTPTAQAITQIQAAISAASMALGDGYFQSHTFQEGLVELSLRAGGSEYELRKLVPQIEAVNGILGLTGINARSAASDLASLSNSAGATDKAFANMNDGAEAKLTILKNNMVKKLSDAGNGMLDVVTDVSNFLNDSFETDAIDGLIATVGVLISTFGVYKAQLMVSNAIKLVGNDMAYEAEIAALTQLLPAKQTSKNADVDTLVTKEQLSVKRAQEVIAIRAAAQARMQELQAIATTAKAEALAASVTHKAALEKALSSQSAVRAAQTEHNLAKQSNDIQLISLAMMQLIAAEGERHIAVKAREATANSLSIAQSKVTSATTAVETMQQGINTAATNAGTRAKTLMSLAITKLGAAFKALSTAFKANPFGLILTGISIVRSAMSAFNKETDDSAIAMREATREADAEKIELYALEKILKDSTQPYQIRAQALRELKGIMPDYNASLSQEGLLIEDNTDSLIRYIEQLKYSSLAKVATNKLTDAQVDFNNWFDSIGKRGKEILFNVGQWRSASAQYGEDTAREMGYKMDPAGELMYDGLIKTMSEKKAEIKKWSDLVDEYIKKSVMGSYSNKTKPALNPESISGKTKPDLSSESISDATKAKEEYLKLQKQFRDQADQIWLSTWQSKIDIETDAFKKSEQQIELNFAREKSLIQKYVEEQIELQQKIELEEYRASNKGSAKGFEPKTLSREDLPKNIQDEIHLKYRVAGFKYKNDTKNLLKDLLGNYQTYTNQREAIETKFNADIDTMKARNVNGMYDKQIKEAEKKKQEELKKVNDAELKNTQKHSGLLVKVFSNASDMSRNQLKTVLESTRQLIDYLSGVSDVMPEGIDQDTLDKMKKSPQEMKIVYDQLRVLQGEYDKDTKYPFSNFIKGFENLKQSQQLSKSLFKNI